MLRDQDSVSRAPKFFSNKKAEDLGKSRDEENRRGYRSRRGRFREFRESLRFGRETSKSDEIIECR